jgi:hypothetical protein
MVILVQFHLIYVIFYYILTLFLEDHVFTFNFLLTISIFQWHEFEGPFLFFVILLLIINTCM